MSNQPSWLHVKSFQLRPDRILDVQLLIKQEFSNRLNCTINITEPDDKDPVAIINIKAREEVVNWLYYLLNEKNYLYVPKESEGHRDPHQSCSKPGVSLIV